MCLKNCKTFNENFPTYLQNTRYLIPSILCFFKSKHGLLRPSQKASGFDWKYFSKFFIFLFRSSKFTSSLYQTFLWRKKTFTQVYKNPSFRRVKTWALSAHLWRWVWPLPARRDWWPRTCSYQTVLPSFSCRWLSSQPHVSVRRANNINYQSISKYF